MGNWWNSAFGSRIMKIKDKHYRTIKAKLRGHGLTDTTKFNGVGLENDTYDLYVNEPNVKCMLRSTIDSKAVRILRKHFIVVRQNHYFAGTYTYLVTPLNK